MVWCSLCVCLREQFYDMSSNVAYGQTWETLNWISWLQSQIVSQREGEHEVDWKYCDIFQLLALFTADQR